MPHLNCNVCMLVSLYDALEDGLLYCHVICTGCQSEFLCCFVCDLQVHLQNRTVRFGRSPASYMRQHFKVTHDHALNDEEIPKQAWQRVDERVRNTVN